MADDAVIIGITTSRSRTPEGRPRDWLNASYIEAVNEAGGIPVLIPNQCDPRILDRLDGLVFSGGGDYAPERFGAEDRGTAMGGVVAERDATELALMTHAPAEFPILGICRGIQGLAVGFGGTLIQDIPTQVDTSLAHAQQAEREAVTHQVRVDEDSKLGRILGADSLPVNSFHHQAVDAVPEGFRAVAWAPDGLIEGLEHVERPFCLGVQWHPENLVGGQDHARRLFRALIDAARVYRSQRRG